MSDTAPADGQAAEAPAGTPTDSTGRPIPPPPAPQPADPATIEAFEAVDGGEVDELDERRRGNAEAARYRRQLREVEAAHAPFGALNEGTRGALADVATYLAQGDNANAARLLANYAEQLGGAPAPAQSFDQGEPIDIEAAIERAVDRALGGMQQQTARERQVAVVTEQVNAARSTLGVTAGDDRDEAIRSVALKLMRDGTTRVAGDAYTEAYRRLFGEPPAGIESHDGPGGQTASLTPPASGEPAVQQAEPAKDHDEARQRVREALAAQGYNTRPGFQ